jgi:putative hydrolase of the HAD superfamily
MGFGLPPSRAASSDGSGRRRARPSPRPPQALLLDLDDTVLDGTGAADALAVACRAIAVTLPRAEASRVQEAYRQAWNGYQPEVEPLCWTGRMAGVSAGLETWRRTLRACGCTDAALVRSAFETHRRFSRDAYRLFPDAGKLLSAIRGAAIRTALVTNGPSDVQRDKLRILGIEDSFDAVLISGEVGTAKPDPALFDAALDALEVEPGVAWHVGDGLTNDVGGARAAGLSAVWLNRTGRRPPAGNPPDLEISSLAQLAGLLGLNGEASHGLPPRPVRSGRGHAAGTPRG